MAGTWPLAKEGVEDIIIIFSSNLSHPYDWQPKLELSAENCPRLRNTFSIYIYIGSYIVLSGLFCLVLGSAFYSLICILYVMESEKE